MKKICLLTFCLIAFSCADKKKSENSIDEKFVLENIKLGMNKEEVFSKIGIPKDSVEYVNHRGENVKSYSYDTNNLFDYDLNILVDTSDTVISISFN